MTADEAALALSLAVTLGTLGAYALHLLRLHRRLRPRGTAPEPPAGEAARTNAK